jgi:hypothetical protein
LLYGLTNNLKAKKILEKLKFKKIKIPVFYKDSITKEIKRETNSICIFEFKKMLLRKLNKLQHFYIGVGQI